MIHLFIVCASSPSSRAYASFSLQAQAQAKTKTALLKLMIAPRLVEMAEEIMTPLLASIVVVFAQQAY